MLKRLQISASVILLFAAFSPAILFAHSLEWVGSYDSLTYATDVVVNGNYAYVVDGVRGLVILDISNPSAPLYVGSYNGRWNETCLAMRGSYVYLGSGYTEPYAGLFSIVDVSNPANPILIDSISFDWEVTEIEPGFENVIIYIATYGGNYIIAADDPHNLRIVNTFETQGYPFDFMNFYQLYVADGPAGLSMFDVSSPSNPELIGNCDTPGNALKVARTNWTWPYFYVADDDSGLAIINIENLTNPFLANRINLTGHVKNIIMTRYYAFLINDSLLMGYNIIDAALPESTVSVVVSPVVKGLDAHVDFPYFEGYVYLACQNTLQIYRFNSGECNYIPGDINGNGSVNGPDIVYSIGYFRGSGPPPRYNCHPACPLTRNPFYAAGDINGDCAFNGVDITYFVRYLRMQVPFLLYCPDCPPADI